MIMDEKQQKILKYMDKWMELREQGITLTEYCKERKAESVGVYGYGRLGRHLVWELENEGFHVSWIMDQRYSVIDINNKEYKLLPPDEMSYVKDADMIIVTAIEDYYNIESELCKYTSVEVISVEQLLKIFIEGQ